MNLLLLDPREIDDDGVARLEGRRGRHLTKILRVEVGEELRAGLLGGAMGSAEVVAVEGKKAVCVRFLASTASTESTASMASDERPTPDVDLVVGMPRPQVLHRVLQTCAAMSVRRLDLTNSWKVEKSYFQSPSAEDDAIRRQLRLGAEQGVTTHLPEVHLQKLFVPFVESLEASSGRGSRPLRFVAHPGAELDLEEAMAADALPGSAFPGVQLAIGPEGGWIDREVETLRGAGFRPVRLGPWILRVEVAVAASLAQLHLVRRGL